MSTLNLTRYGVLLRYAALFLIAWNVSSVAVAAGKDDPFLIKVLADQLEWQNDDSDTKAWDMQAWAGKNWHKLWLYSEGEQRNGETESENMLTYSAPIAPFWDVQVGLGRDITAEANHNWAVVGINGLAPYYFETQAHVLVDSDGTLGVRASFEYELLFTQFLILTPELEIDAYSDNLAELGLGKGLSSLTAGLRLRYEIRREFAPYVDVEWDKAYGQTADYRRTAGEPVSDARFVAGVRIWF